MSYKYKCKAWVPAKRDEVFEFFSNAENLEHLTPSWLNFQILTPCPIELRQGALIDYRLRIHWIPVRWRTEISLWEPPFRFVDTQLKGPYRSWVHEHRFVDEGSGTSIEDEVNYDFFGGPLLHRYLVRPDIEKIFSYRQEQIQKIFDSSARSS